MEYFIGLISGTSMDGIDAALVRFDNQKIQLLTGTTFPFEAALRQRLRQSVVQAQTLTTREIGELDGLLGDAFATAALSLLDNSDLGPEQIRGIGSHGQTLYHAPGANPPFTLQIGDPNIIAAKTGITVVSDFRRKDMALGGQGAPLAPALHADVFRSDDEDRVVVNLGGIANVTVLPASGPVSGFDTGPGNTLMDAWIGHCKQLPYDDDGQWASLGSVDESLLEELKSDAYFKLSPPKSTGPEYFNLDWLWNRLGPTTETPVNIQAILSRLTADTVVEAIQQLAPASQSVFICGGGAHNSFLCATIAAGLKGMQVADTTSAGIHPDWVEAVVFAWLSKQTLNGKPGNIPSVTGARRLAILGTITSP